VLKNDDRAIFAAASRAQRAADFLHGLQATASAQTTQLRQLTQRSICAETPCPDTRHGAMNHLPVLPWSGYGSSRCRLDSVQIVRRGLACPSIGDNVESDLLSLVEDAHASAFDRADVHEHILASIIRLNEAEAFLVVEPLHGSLCHIALLFRYVCNVAAHQRSRFVRDLEKSRQSRRGMRGEAKSFGRSSMVPT
jgi:hypothetical protein